MSQTSKIIAISFIAFIAYISAKGKLGQYLGVFIKSEPQAEQ